MAVIPANTELDFKALAHYTADRKIEMLPLKEVQAATGYIRGGVTALACKKDYPVYIDERAQICDVILHIRGNRRPADPPDNRRLHPRRQGQGRAYCKNQYDQAIRTIAADLNQQVFFVELPLPRPGEF